MLAAKPLDGTRDMTKPFDGELQVEKTLTADPLKLYLDVEANFDAIRDKAQDLLWPGSQDDARWADVADRYAEQPGMPWLPPKGLETLRSIAVSRAVWEDLGNGYVTRQPKKKQTSAQVVRDSSPDDTGRVRLKINPQNGGPAPRIHYAQDAPVSEQSPVFTDSSFTTVALRVNVLVVDPSGQFETGPAVTWTNDLIIRNELINDGARRSVKLLVAPQGNLRYTLDGSEPREGTEYTSPIEIGDAEALIRVFAEASGLEAKAEFRFQANGKKGVEVDPVKKATLISRAGRKLDSRVKVFEAVKQASEKTISFEGVILTIGQGSQSMSVNIGEVSVDASFLQAILALGDKKFDPNALITMTFRKATFLNGHDLKEFADKLGFELQAGDVEQ